MDHSVDRYFIVDVKLQILNISNLEKYDSQKMYKIYDEWPEIAKNSYFKAVSIPREPVKHIIFAGMGGSGTMGDFFAAILSKTNLHVNVVKGYLLPKNVSPETLVVVTSISGNTAETFSILKAAKKIGCRIIVFSSGGEMEEYSNKNNIEFIKIEKYHSPRASFVNFLYSILRTLEQIFPIKKEDVENSIKQLEITKKNICSDNLELNNQSLDIATSLKEVPLIYYPGGFEAAAIRFKCSLQENAKIHAIVEDVVEASHNGITSWEIKSSVQPILLQGKDDYIKTKERWTIFEEYFNKNNIKFKKITSIEGDIISKLVNLIYILDYVSIYLAVINKIDPTPVKSIDYIKKRL
jgi:glucose/mannose-6-phosphate isomerase